MSRVPWFSALAEALLGWWCRFWIWVAVFACARRNAVLDHDLSVFVVTQTGPSRAESSREREA